LLDLILLPTSASVCLAGWAHYAYACVERVGVAPGMPCGIPQWNARIIPEKGV